MYNAFISADFAGAALLVLGLILIASELSAPSHGGIAFLGLLSIAAGAVAFTFPEFAAAVSTPILIVGFIAALSVVIIASSLAVSVRRRQIVTGREAMLGATGVVLSWNGTSGHILIQGERWLAKGQAQLIQNTVRVMEIDGLTLSVETAAPDRSADILISANGE